MEQKLWIPLEKTIHYHLPQFLGFCLMGKKQGNDLAVEHGMIDSNAKCQVSQDSHLHDVYSSVFHYLN